MITYAAKTRENKSNGVAHRLAKQKPISGISKSPAGLIDNRPESIVQRKLQALADASHHVQQGAKFQAMADARETDTSSPDVIQRIEIDLPMSYKDTGENITYEFEDALSVDLTNLIATEVDPEDPGLYYFALRLKAAREHYEEEEKPNIVADIDRALFYLENPGQITWAQAEPGKRVENQRVDYAGIDRSIKDLTTPGLFDRIQYPLYTAEILKYSKQYANFKTLAKYSKLKEYITPLKSISSKTIGENMPIVTEILNLFHWLMPLHDRAVRGVANTQSLMQRMKICLHSKIDTLWAANKGKNPLPDDALIRKNATTKISGYDLGTVSEIKTGIIGALKSGETATPRYLETQLTEHYRNRYVAGHLVADTLGGKNTAYNLTPMTNTFNTSGGSNGIKAPENDALRRLKARKVIFYRSEAIYGNKSSEHWYQAVKPTRFVIRVTDLNLKEGGEPTDIEDYNIIANERIYVLTML